MVGRETSQHGIPTYPNVLTPDMIPEFCIPPKLKAQQGMRASPRHQSVPDICKSAFEVRVSYPPETHIIQVDSVDEPLEEESTNADPQSQAALSLPHLPKAHTSYGFCTLLESPNTRRKESLFHNDPASLPILLPKSVSNTTSYQRESSCNFTTLTLRSLRRSSTFDSDTASSTDTSPFGSPLLRRSLPNSLLKALSQDKMFSRNLRVNSKSTTLRNNSVSTDEDSSTDSSPCVTRRASEEWTHNPLMYSPLSLISLGQFPIDSMIPMDMGGILRISAEYSLENLRLRIRLVSAEGLFQPTVDTKNINCYISLCLVPGKNQKQKSTLIRGSRNPIFNEDFFFVGLEPQDLMQKTLKLKAKNKASGIWKENVLGKSKVQLLSVLPV
ncbi:C2 calcium-dependent domain-containing protein 4C-like isoform 1-T2 [Discoglossus pictus]